MNSASSPSIDICGRKIGPGRPVFIICEIGMNHNGDFDRAIHMIDLAAAIGADCAKFQMRHLDRVYRERTLSRSGEDLSTEYTLDLLEKFELTPAQHKLLLQHCTSRGILYMCTPWDEVSADTLQSMGVGAFKVASADLNNLPLLTHLSRIGKPLILSTGMSTETEIKTSIDLLTGLAVPFALLHCNSTYPAPLQDINLSYLHRLAAMHPFVGYSGHERGIAVSTGAVALGAQILERHFTLDRNMEGPDHAASLGVDDFRALVQGVRELELALGGDGAKTLSQGVLMNRENLGKSLVAARKLENGAVLQRADILVRSPGQGLAPHYIDQLVGRKLLRDMETEDFFYDSDLRTDFAKPRKYSFRRPWGVPVRYHDFSRFASRVPADVWEFHLSYKDMDLVPGDFLKGEYEQGFVVHAPELFAGSHLMDLATPDREYRERSLRETQRVIDITRSLKRFFPKTERPMIVANIGGISMDGNLPEEEKPAYYQRFVESLRALDLEGVEIIPQTMAPFPWHFGGQRYQNLFVHPAEIAAFCSEHKIRMCFDVSHSMLTSNHYGYDLVEEFTELVGPHTAHLHMGDAAGVNGEGLQVGEGEIDFKRLGAALDRTCPTASFIPEIWQGHKNDGEGFWIALEKLEGDL